jgi:type I restriction enzyme S subunit
MADRWLSTRLGDVVSIKHGWPFKSEYFSESLTGKPIVVAVGNFRYEGGFRFDETPTKEYRSEYPREYALTPGDLLLVMTCQTQGGEILGVPARIPDDGRTYLHNQRLGKVLIKEPELIDNQFLYYLFRSRSFNAELCASASGSKILHTAPSRIEAFEFERPPIEEQRAIANVLVALDDKIEQNRRTVRMLERVARAIFRAWFVDFEPVKAKAVGATWFHSMPHDVFDALPRRFIDSEIGPLPDGWETRALAKVATFLNGLALQKYPPKADRSDLPVIKIAELRNASTEGADRANADLPEQYIINDGDLLFSWSGTLEAEFWFGGKGALNQHLFKVTSSHFPNWFCLLWIRHHLAWFRAIAASKATTMGHIQRGHLQEAQVVVPPSAVLAAADAVIGPLYELHAQLMIESRTLKAMRDFLLPKLLSGDVRVTATEGPDAE